MHVVANSLDDLLRKVYRRLVRKNDVIVPTKGNNVEEFGNLLTLKNPRARLSRTETKGTVFSCLGEFVWYMSGSNSLDFIQHYFKDYGKYSDDGVTVYGAYGPRLFDKGGINQLDYIVTKLKENSASRKAVIQLFDAGDVVEDHEDVPCTCTLQFVVRKNRLHLHVNMRSNDAFKGLPHDVFSFTLLQEFLAVTLGLGLGQYHHSVGSLHLYTEDIEKAELFLKEGLQDDVPMPAMPIGDPTAGITALKQAEKTIRDAQRMPPMPSGLSAYWQDLIRLLAIYSAGSAREIVAIKNEMSSRTYENFIRKRHSLRMRQTDLPLFDRVMEETGAGASSR
ncbi:thymidylate synthase [Rhizobium laguerreae]|uniref:thymidylate synthase n=1 Tax=Rhizobium laguerreae TaxID=1076926 RepID=UPI001C920630|nr:thymidylate synthase [Rhizobium laguerreae]MBY3181349.1 thymidylate synthase [Rhizobium laguerreae]